MQCEETLVTKLLLPWSVSDIIRSNSLAKKNRNKETQESFSLRKEAALKFEEVKI